MPRSISFAVALLLCLLGSFKPAFLAAQVRDMEIRWSTLQVGRFEVHYHEPLEPVARKAAAVLAAVDDGLSRDLQHRFGGRLHVVVTDGTDSANGSATAIPYPIMRLFATAPDDLSALSDHDDWLATLIIHEHTHILHLDNIGGLPALLNLLLGRTYTPNGAQPRWFIEGYATYMESARTSGGRLRSSVFEMYMRMAVLEGPWLSLDQISNATDAWPGGHVPYLYGSRFLEFIAERHGEQALAEMAKHYGRQPLPYGVNRVARRTTGKTFVDLYADWKASIEKEQRAVEARVRADGLLEGQRLTHHGQGALAPRYIRDDAVVYYVDDGRSDAVLRLLDAKTGAPLKDLTRTLGPAYAAADPTGRYLYYDSVDSHRDHYFLRDLFRLELATGKRERLTRGLRARYPDISNDGRHIVFVVGGAGSSELRIADVADIAGTQQVIWRGDDYDQVYTPRFSPDGTTIAFSAWRAGGMRDLYLFDRKTLGTRRIMADRALDSGPAFSPDGTTLYFSSDRGGIANLYAYDLSSRRLHRLTNVVSGAFQPAPSPDGKTLLYLGYTAEGFDLFSLPIDRTTWRAINLEYDEERGPPPPTYAPVDTPAKPYNPVPSALPRNYLIGFDEDGFGPRLKLTTEGGDVVGFFNYYAGLAISLTRGYVSGDFVFRLNRSPLPIRLSFSRHVALASGLVVADMNRGWVRDAIGAELTLSYPLPRAFHSESVSLSYSITDLRKAEDFGGTLDPNTAPPTLPSTGRLAGLNAGWSLSTLRRHALDMTTSAGTAVTLRFSLADPGLGSEYRALAASVSVAQHIENPWIDHHVLALRYAGGVSGGDAGHLGLYAVGGFPEGPSFDDLLSGRMLGGVALRGYLPGSRRGTQFHLAQVEYRFPIVRIERGIETLPIFLRRLHAMVFTDAGDAFFGPFDLATFRIGSGAEVFADVAVGYFVRLSLRLGLAYGFHEEGGLRWYAHLGAPF